jgi:hypothetical protein
MPNFIIFYYLIPVYHKKRLQILERVGNTLVSVVQDDGRKEVELKAGATIKITTNDELKEKCTADLLWVDYKNITKVLRNFNHSVQ